MDIKNAAKFFDDKFKSLNPNNLPMATGIPWYQPKDYKSCMSLFGETEDRTGTFDEWLAKATSLEKELTDRGMRILRIVIEPGECTRWCAAQGHADINRKYLGEYVNHNVHDILVKELKQ